MLGHSDSDASRIERALEDNRFYRKKNTIAIQRSEQDFVNYPGDFDFNQVLKGKGNRIYYQPPSKETSDSREKNVIAVSDGLLAYGVPENTITLFDAMVKAGFELYYWNGTDAILTTDLASDRTRIRVGREKDIIECLAQKNIGRDRIYHLDYFALRRLLADYSLIGNIGNENLKKTTGNLLFASDFYYFNVLPPDLHAYLNAHTFKVCLSYISRSDNPLPKEYADKVRLLVDKFPENITGLILQNVDDISLFQAVYQLKNLQDLVWQERDIDKQQESKKRVSDWGAIKPSKAALTKLTRCVISGYYNDSTIPDKQVSHIINNSPALEKFTFHRKGFAPRSERDTYTLKSLKLWGTKDVGLIKKSADSLRHLRLNFVNELTGDLLSNTASFPQLVTLSLGFSQYDVILQILSKAPKLQKLTVELPKGTLPEKKPILSLLQLKSITLKSTSDPVFARYILENAPNLITMDIEGASVGCSSQYHFEKIRTLKLSGAEADFAANVIRGLTDVEYINIACSYVTDETLKAWMPDKIVSSGSLLYKLKAINAKETHPQTQLVIPLGTYLNLIAKAPLITAINLAKVEFRPDLDEQSLADVHAFQLPQIETINLSKSKITGKMLAKILRRTPNIRELILNECHDITDLKPEDLPDFDFTKLTKLSCKKSEIRGDVLAKLMAQSPNLVTLEIAGCPNLLSFNIEQYPAKKRQYKLSKYPGVLEELSLKTYLAFAIRYRKITSFYLNSVHVNLDTATTELEALTSEQLQHIQELVIANHQQTPQLFGQIIQKLTNLESIKSEGYSLCDAPIDECHIPTDVRLPKLEVLELQSIDITGAAIIRLIQLSTRIRVLKLGASKYLQDLAMNLITTVEDKLNYLQVFSSSHPVVFPLAVYFKLASLAKNKGWPLDISAKNAADFDNVPPLHFPNIRVREILGPAFSRFLQLAPTVESINISGTIPGDFDLTIPLPSLGILDVSCSEFPRAVVERIINLAPNLRKLVLQSYSNVVSQNDGRISNVTQMLRREQLQEISCTGTPISSSLLFTIISGANELRVLRLERFAEKDFQLQLFKESSFPHLHTLELYNSNMPYDVIWRLITTAPNLKRISIGNCHFWGENELPDIVKAMPLNKLKTIDIQSVDFKLENFPYKLLAAILQVAPNVEKFIYNRSVDVTTQVKFSDLFGLVPRPLTKLITLEFTNLTFDSRDYQRLVEMMPNLNEIYLRRCHLEQKQKLRALPINKIQKIDIFGGEVDDQALTQIIRTAPELRRLHLQLYQVGIITEALFVALITCCPELSYIDLQNIKFKNLTTSMLPREGLLLNLRHFAFHKFAFSEEIQQWLRRHVPNAKIEGYEPDDAEAKSSKEQSILDWLKRPADETTPKDRSSDERLEGSKALDDVASSGSGASAVDPGSYEVTGDGNPPDTTLRANKIFFPSDHPRVYRFAAYSELDLSGENVKLVSTANKRFIKPKHKIDYVRSPLWPLYQNKYHNPEKPSHRFCEPEVFKISNTPRPIPSHYPQEWIIAFYTDFKGKFTIEYVEDEDLYYIWATTPTPDSYIQINFIVTIAKPSVLGIQPPELQRLIEHCYDFHRGTLVINGPRTAEKEVQARFEQQVGSCENRAIVFKNKLDELRRTNKNYASYRTRIIRHPGVHAFTEMSDGRSWKLVELGGYDDKLVINEMPLENQFAPFVPAGTGTRSAAGGFLNLAQTYSPSDPIDESDLDPALMPWKNKYQPLPALAQDLQQALAVAGKNSLIMFDQPDDCLALMAHLATTRQPYLFIDTIDELQWRGAGLVFKNATEFALRRNFSRIRYFANNTPDGVMFINWSKVSRKDRAALHCVNDKVRTLEGEELPRQLAIGGFDSDDKGEDFRSRQHARYIWAPNNIDLYHGRRKETAVPESAEVLIIDLYNASHGWENLLFGYPHILKKRFTMQYSDFLTACVDKKKPFRHLHIKNPPWHVREFQLFWQQALQQQSFVYCGKQFTLAPDFQLTYSVNHPLQFDAIDSAITRDAEYEFPFNMHTLSTYFEHYQFQDETFVKKTGLLSRYRTLRVVATEEMQFDHWYRLLSEAKQHGCTLHIYAAPGVVMPSEIPQKYYRIYNPEPAAFDINTMDKVSFALIETKQSIALIAAELKKKFPKAMSISLSSAHDFGDVFYQNHGQLVGEPNSEDMEIDAKFFPSDPWKHLQQENNVVIIEGTLIQSMINVLSPSLLNGKSELLENGQPVLFKGKLFVVTDSHVPFAKNRYVDEVIESPTATPEKTSPMAEPEKAPASELSSNDFDLSLATCQRFKQQRFEKIMAGFKQSSIISCIGETGIGKTTYFLPPKHAYHRGFVQDYFEQTGRIAVMYVGENSIEDFANHMRNQELCRQPKNSDAFLFLDEAKLSRKQLSILKGLKHKEPHLLINGHYYSYPSQNNLFVFLVDNPDDYGGARQQQEFLKNYAVTVLIDEPNHAYLYREIIKRLFDKYGPSLDAADSEQIGRTLLTIYDTINAIANTKKKFLSPRHLHMMTLLFNKYRQEFSSDEMDLIQLVIAASLTIVGDGLSPNMEEDLYTFLTKAYHYDQNSFHRFQNKYFYKYIAEEVRKPNKDFLFTNNHRHVLIALHTFLSMRELEDFHFGLLLEGPSGIGKSEGIKHYLRQLNIPYSQFSLGKNYETNSTLLADSAKTRVKMIDEINASAEEHEKDLNTLIMDGDLVVATLNSIANAGRSILPFALRSRFTLVQAKPYPASEMIDVLRFKGLPKAEAQLWAGKLIKAITYAQQKGLEEPNLRHVELAAGLIKPEQPVVASGPAVAAASAVALPSSAAIPVSKADAKSKPGASGEESIKRLAIDADLDLSGLILITIKRILSNEKFWRDQVVIGVIADIPQGIDRMRFNGHDLAALRAIAKTCLNQPFYSFLTDIVKNNGITNDFYRILQIEDLVTLKRKLDEFEKLQISKVVSLPAPSGPGSSL